MRLPGWMIFFSSNIAHKEKLGNINPLTCSRRATSSCVIAETQAEPADADGEEVRLQRAARQQSGDTVYSHRVDSVRSSSCQQGWNSTDSGYWWWHRTWPECYHSLCKPQYDPECRPPSTQLTNHTKQVATALHMPAQLDCQGSCTVSTPLTLKRVQLCASCITFQSTNTCCTEEGHS